MNRFSYMNGYKRPTIKLLRIGDKVYLFDGHGEMGEICAQHELGNVFIFTVAWEGGGVGNYREDKLMRI